MESIQSALAPHGPSAAITAEIARVLLVGGGLVFLLVMALATWAVFGRRREWLAGRAAVVAGGIAFPTVVLFALLVYTLFAAGRIADAHGPPALRIEVVGEQWWWRVHYLDAAGERDFATANEIRIPVGRTVEVALRSADVLHSFWVPALAGKLDLVPGRTNRLRLARRPAGRLPRPVRRVLRRAARADGVPRRGGGARTPSSAGASGSARRRARGERCSFLARCAACHAVRGTPAAGTLGPDLTHVGSRLAIGAGILPNNAGAIAGWIASSQRIKPGNLMPEFHDLGGAELAAIAAYVASLE